MPWFKRYFSAIIISLTLHLALFSLFFFSPVRKKLLEHPKTLSVSIEQPKVKESVEPTQSKQETIHYRKFFNNTLRENQNIQEKNSKEDTFSTESEPILSQPTQQKREKDSTITLETENIKTPQTVSLDADALIGYYGLKSPEYPARALSLKMEASILTEITFNLSGKVSGIQFKTEGYPLFKQEISKALSQWDIGPQKNTVVTLKRFDFVLKEGF